MPVWPVWKRAIVPVSSMTSYRSYATERSLGKKPWMLGWNLKPLTPYSSTSRRACLTPALPRKGSMEAKGIRTSALAAAASATSSFGTGAVPVADSASTVKITAAIFRSR